MPSALRLPKRLNQNKSPAHIPRGKTREEEKKKKEGRGAGDISNRIIFHLDMDHFYTAVEERERPEIKGNPVIVGADPKEGKGRGVVSTSNYEARKAGVRSGLPISQAWRLCPEAVYLPPNFPLYIRVSGEIMELALLSTRISLSNGA